MSVLPAPHVLHAALATTWPAATQTRLGPLLLRDGKRGGKRVSAAVQLDAVEDADISAAEAVEARLFMLREGEDALDALLAERGYAVVDPTLIYAAFAHDIAAPPPPVSLFAHWPPLAIAGSAWSAQGIGPERQAVMARAPLPKAAFLIRHDDRVAGVAFCALGGAVAMVHAIEILPLARRRGLGQILLRGVADWALAQGGEVLALAVTEANAGARALYESLGMTVAARYHYRAAPPSAARD